MENTLKNKIGMICSTQIILTNLDQCARYTFLELERMTVNELIELRDELINEREIFPESVIKKEN